LEWLNAQKQSRGISRIIVAGESGGANLSCALTLKAKKENKLHLIDGVYAFCPYIFGEYGSTGSVPLPSLARNDGLMLEKQEMALLASIYVSEGDNTRNPLAWPYWATSEDLKGLPPHVVSVNELDPLLDEGMAYYHKLLHAG
jgi:acetyl esterase